MSESMTGFSFLVTKEKGLIIEAESRSLNARGLEITIKGLNDLNPDIERSIRKYIGENFQRGKFFLSINLIPLKPDIHIDLDDAKFRLAGYKKAFKEIGISPSDDKLLSLIINNGVHAPYLKDKKVADAVFKAVKKVLNDLKKERTIEGKTLAREIDKRLKCLESHLTSIEKRKPVIISAIRENISNRIKELAGENSERAWMEAAILADKSDIREEVVRFRSHIERFKEILKDKSPKGKKLDFLCQEMQREANTIASKLTAISEVVVDAKSEIEKIRQQLQNLE